MLVAIVINSNIISPMVFLKMFEKNEDSPINLIRILIGICNNISEGTLVSVVPGYADGVAFINNILEQEYTYTT